MDKETKEYIDSKITLLATKVGVVAEDIVSDTTEIYGKFDAKVDKFIVRFAKKDFSTLVIFAVWGATLFSGYLLGRTIEHIVTVL